jgi:endonuclease/exonuclease/phosphatase family metal-dependent hydrolase
MQKIIWIIGFLLLFGCGEQTTAPSVSDTPTNLKLYLVNSGTVRITWEDRSTRETGYLVQRRKDSDYEFTNLNSLMANTELYLDENLEQNTKYYYRVAAILADTLSQWSNVRSIITQSTISDMQFGTASTFEVMTWNIEKFPKNDNTTVTYVKQALLALQADIVALQEIKNQSKFDTLITELQLEDNESGWEGKWQYCDSYGNNLAFIYRGSQFSNVQTYTIYNNDWYAFPRPPLIFEGSFQNQFFVIINNHFKAMGDADSVARRREASLKLDQYIRENLNNINVIVLGDMNDELTDSETQNVFWNFITEPDYYRFADWEIAYSPSSEWSYPSWPSHIDHILITYPLFSYFNQLSTITSTIKIDTFMSGGWNEYKTNISDHRPVAMKIALE